MSLTDRLYFMWLLTNCSMTRANIRESFAARTDPATMHMSCLKLAPGVSLQAPFTNPLHSLQPQGKDGKKKKRITTTGRFNRLFVTRAKPTL
ncbi:hypothetical protein CRG98_000355 [Punica granatum]|uniref:Uncharacterized protein n=1 Tax=Punica granatum TaxID=22663 RepID=A0A2I0LEY8_PUNGR|nr:hypothetical protein CRG98_000355 [Punica granatum]